MNTTTILREVSKGRTLSPEEFSFFLCRREETDEILDWANQLNWMVNGDRVTFIHNRNINYTNVCINHCSFCGFRRDRKDEESYFLSVEGVIREIEKSPEVSEVCIQGGLFPGLEFSYILEMLQEIKLRFPRIHIHAFSPMEVYYFSQRTRKSISFTLERLIQSGLDSLPGTAAEVLDDRLRKEICPEKIDVATWIEVVKTAHRLGLRSTATILFGHIETPEQTARHLHLLRGIQEETHGFTELIPLPFVPFHTPLGKRPGSKDIFPFPRIRLFHALCRIFFYHSIQNIQASWPKLGLDHALCCVFSGVNDLGGTLYQENITRSAGGNHGEKVSLAEFRQKILQAGKIPQLRNTLYEPLNMS
ncbi:MAG: 5-amino-6-(D-ribitylamino)uracil--L-tyrosine 4-hydroxyphenyl transferase CofH [Thermodesulfobacteriota bacterium]